MTPYHSPKSLTYMSLKPVPEVPPLAPPEAMEEVDDLPDDIYTKEVDLSQVEYS